MKILILFNINNISLLLILGWNHRGVYILSRSEKLQKPIKRKLSTAAHRRMRMDYHRYNANIYIQIDLKDHIQTKEKITNVYI